MVVFRATQAEAVNTAAHQAVRVSITDFVSMERTAATTLGLVWMKLGAIRHVLLFASKVCLDFHVILVVLPSSFQIVSSFQNVIARRHRCVFATLNMSSTRANHDL